MCSNLYCFTQLCSGVESVVFFCGHFLCYIVLDTCRIVTQAVLLNCRSMNSGCVPGHIQFHLLPHVSQQIMIINSSLTSTSFIPVKLFRHVWSPLLSLSIPDYSHDLTGGCYIEWTLAMAKSFTSLKFREKTQSDWSNKVLYSCGSQHVGQEST